MIARRWKIYRDEKIELPPGMLAISNGEKVITFLPEKQARRAVVLRNKFVRELERIILK